MLGRVGGTRERHKVFKNVDVEEGKIERKYSWSNGSTLILFLISLCSMTSSLRPLDSKGRTSAWKLLEWSSSHGCLARREDWVFPVV
jgi:hypothetical protein